MNTLYRTKSAIAVFKPQQARVSASNNGGGLVTAQPPFNHNSGLISKPDSTTAPLIQEPGKQGLFCAQMGEAFASVCC